jgi:calcium-dependent protein kinase
LALGKKKIVGTAYYISPEVINGVYDEKCDIWSIGVILFILVTGVPPFDGESDKEILGNVQKNKVNFISRDFCICSTGDE